MAATKSNKSKSQLWTRAAVLARILDGDTLIIYHDHLLHISEKWLDAHPGGTLSLLHYVGRDATDEIEAYHADDTLNLIPRYSIGRVQNTLEEPWVPLVPPIMAGWVRRKGRDGKSYWYREAAEKRSSVNTETSPSSEILLVPKESASIQEKLLSGPTSATLEPPPAPISAKVQAQHSHAYRELHQRVKDAGLYETPYITGYGPEVARYTLLASISAYAYCHSWFKTSALFLGLFWHQLVFAAHDLGHMGVTHNWTADRLISITLADFIGGLSIGWWVQVSCKSLPCVLAADSFDYRIITFTIVSLFFLNLCRQAADIDPDAKS